ncbi:hypothetical protein D3C87_1401920 [compost metagenome]
MHHLHGQAFAADGVPQGTRQVVLGDGDFLDASAQDLKPGDGAAHLVGNTWILIGQLEAFLQDADPQPAHTSLQIIAVGVDLRSGLARVESVGTGHDFQHQCVVTHVAGDGTDMVDGGFDRHDAGVRHQTVSRLHAIGAAER